MEKDAWWNQPDTLGNPYTPQQDRWINDFIICLKEHLFLDGMSKTMITKLGLEHDVKGIRSTGKIPSVLIYFDQKAIGLNDDIGVYDKAHINLFGNVGDKHRQIDGAGSHLTLYLSRGEKNIRYGLYRDGDYRGVGVSSGFTLENGKDQNKVDIQWPKYWSELIMTGVHQCINKLSPSRGVPWGGSKTRKRKQRKTKGNRKSKMRKSKRIKKKTHKY